MDNQTFQKLKDLILKHQDVAVIVKPNPSLDEMAAGLGMYLVLKQMGKNAAMVCPTDPIVAVSSLVGIDQVQKSLGGEGGDLTVSFPYQEGEIEKVSYTLDNGQLNIVVKAGEKGLSFQQKDVLFKRGGKMPSLIICIGVPHLSEINALYNPAVNQGVAVVNIDNKADNEKYGEMVVVDTKWSSVSEQVADFVTLLEPQIELDADTAQNLLNGIDFATNDFKNPRTSYLAFEVAGILMKKGATRQKAQIQPQPAAPDMGSFFPPVPPAPAKPVQPIAPVQPQWSAPVAPQPTWQQIQPLANSNQQSVIPAQQPFGNPQAIGSAQAQEVPQAVQPTTAPTQPSAPAQAPAQTQPTSSKQTPPDWLTPKVYKGSTIL